MKVDGCIFIFFMTGVCYTISFQLSTPYCGYPGPVKRGSPSRFEMVHYTSYYVASFVLLSVLLIALSCLLVMRVVEHLQRNSSDLWGKTDILNIGQHSARSNRIGIFDPDQQVRSLTSVETLTGRSIWKAHCV